MLILDMKKIPIITPWPLIRFTDFSSKFTRRPSGGLVRRHFGGLFEVKVAAVKRNGHQSLSVTPTKPFISYFLERFTG